MFRSLRGWWNGVRDLDPIPIRRGLPVELRRADEIVWAGEMDLDMPPLEMVPDVLLRASYKCFPDSSAKWFALKNRNHPNDHTGYAAIPGDPTTWVMVIEVGRRSTFGVW